MADVDGATAVATLATAKDLTHVEDVRIADRTAVAGTDVADEAPNLGSLLANFLPPAARPAPAATRVPKPSRVQRHLRRLLAQDLGLRERVAADECRQEPRSKQSRLAQQIRIELVAASTIRRS